MSRAFSPFTLGIGFTALLALVPELGPKVPPTGAPVKAEAKGVSTPVGPKATSLHALLDQCLRDRPKSADGTVAVTILTLPDPQRTSMAFWFDLRLNAVQRAFRTLDFLPRAFYLPWEAKPKDEGGSGVSSTFPEATPGFIWFAREGAKPRYHALFIVSESQSLGINRSALQEALRLASRLPLAEGRISLLGPQFSGSLASLGAALESHFKDPGAPRVHIQGTTTLDAGGIRMLRDATGHPDAQRWEVSPWLCNLSGTAKERLLNWYAAEAGWPKDASKIALFTESNTVYSRDDRSGLAMTPFPFPMGLSRLRSERRAMEQGLAKGSEPQELVLPSTLLGPSEDDSVRVLDTAPQYAADTVRNTELTLAATILSLARRGYTHVGISASDPQDLIFLAERIRAYHPSCTLFTTSGNHALFAHPNYSQAMDGMVLFGGYPVTDSVRALSLMKGDLESPVRFTSEGEYATYYATLLLLDPARAKDPERAFWGRQGFVSIVKGGSIWPLRQGGLEVQNGGSDALNSDVEGRYRKVATHSADLVQYVHSRLRQLALLLVGLGFASVLAFLKPLLEVAGVPRGEPGLRPYRNLVAGAVLTLAISTFLATGYLLPLVVLKGSPWHDPFLWMSLLAWLTMLGLTAWALRGQVNRLATMGLTLMALLPALIAAAWGTRHFLVFMPAYLRFTSPGRGVSLIPTMLLLAAGVALLLRSWFELHRQDQAAFWPAPPGVLDTKLLVMRHLRGLQFEGWTFLLVAVAAAFQWLMPGGLIRPLMDVPAVALVVVGVACGLFSASLFLFWQFHQGWQELQRVLEVLDFIAYRAAFAEVGRLVDWKAMRALGRGLSMHRSSLRGQEILFAQETWVSCVNPGYSARLAALDEGTPTSRQSLGEYGQWRNRLAYAHQMIACGDALSTACANDSVEAAAHQSEVDLFQALRAVHFIRQAFLVLRHLLVGSLGTLILLVLGVAAFDFQPKNDVLLILGAALLGMATWVALVILSMERDPLLCLMEGSPPGEVQLSLGLVENGFRFVLVPLLLLLGTLNPSFGGFLMQVFNPIMHLLK